MDDMEKATLDAIMAIRKENDVTEKSDAVNIKTASVALTDISKSFKNIDKLPTSSMPNVPNIFKYF